MATVPITCGHCGRSVGAEIVADAVRSNVAQSNYVPKPNMVLWLRCPSCGEGSVRKNNSSMILPGALPGHPVGGLPPDVERAWKEARGAHSIGAYTAAEMKCRKILMHIAVDQAQSASGKT
jgi:hypothetical protein